MTKVTKKNTLTTTASDLIQVKVHEGKWTAEEGTQDHSEGWANVAYYAVAGSVLAADYEASADGIGLLILAKDQEEVLNELTGRGFWAQASPLDPEEGKSRYGDGHAGTIDVWRDDDEILLVEGSQSLG